MALVLFFSGFSYYSFLNAVNARVSLDVNPSIEIDLNRNNKVINAVANNADGEAILDGMDLKGSDIKVTLNALIGSMVRQGYLSEIKNSILLSVDSDSEDTAKVLEEELLKELENILGSNSFESSVLAQTVNDDTRLENLAKKYNISLGKAQLIQIVMQESPTYKFEDLAKLSINELNLLKKSANSNITVKGKASDKAYIGKDKAYELALEDAGVKKKDAKLIETDLDFDDGYMVYEIEFQSGYITYEYEIKASDGTILSKEKEDKTPKEESSSSSSTESNQSTTNSNQSAASSNASTNNNQSSTSSGLITDQQALNSALTYLGIGANSISYTTIEYDGEDKEYEIEFYVGSTEYNVDVSAVDGQVIKVDYEVEDDYEYDSSSQSSNTPSSSGSSQPAPAPAPQPSTISYDQAGSIAIGHAGVGNVYDYSIELDDGVYEIEFKSGNYEYSYEIDAASGAILEAEKEYDD